MVVEGMVGEGLVKDQTQLRWPKHQIHFIPTIVLPVPSGLMILRVLLIPLTEGLTLTIHITGRLFSEMLQDFWLITGMNMVPLYHGT